MRGKLIIFLVLLGAGLSGCSNSVSEIGSSLFNNNLFNITLVDSISLKVSTLLADSMITSNTGRLLVGYHDDEKLGTVTAKSIFQLGVSGPVKLDHLTTEYLGLRLYLKRDGYSYYDTTSTQTISVYQLSNSIRLNNGVLYNSSHFEIDSSAAPLGTLTFMPRPHHTDSLEIPLPDDLGQQLMTMAQESDLQLSTTENFIRFFKGLVLVPDSSSSRSILGFTIKPEMRLYYRDLSVSPTKDRWVSFALNQNAYFTSIYSNRAGTLLEPIKKHRESVSSDLTDHEAYFQSGVGLAVRLEMPHLRDFLINDRNFRSSRAVIQLFPIREGSGFTNPLPPAIYLYRVDVLNRLLTPVPQVARLIKDVESGRNTHYEADITAFVNAQIQTDAFNSNALLILLDDKQNHSTVNRLYLGDGRNVQYAMKVSLFYITLSNQ